MSGFWERTRRRQKRGGCRGVQFVSGLFRPFLGASSADDDSITPASQRRHWSRPKALRRSPNRKLGELGGLELSA
jgi:hypothetical protein